MKKSKVIFINPELEKDYNALPEDDPVKKGIKKR